MEEQFWDWMIAAAARRANEEFELIGKILEGVQPGPCVLRITDGRDRPPDPDKKPVPVEIEGGGYNWWYVCEECHGAVDTKDKICPHCKSPLDWSGALWNRVSNRVSQ